MPEKQRQGAVAQLICCLPHKVGVSQASAEPEPARTLHQGPYGPFAVEVKWEQLLCRTFLPSLRSHDRQLLHL